VALLLQAAAETKTVAYPGH